MTLFRLLRPVSARPMSGAVSTSGGLTISSGSTYWTGTVRTTDGSVSDVQAKINAASSGDIIELPAGTFAYSSGIICNSKGVLFRGAGAGRIEGSSASSLAIGTGSKSFTIRRGTVVSGGFTVGETIRAVWKADHSVYMEGTVTSWNGTTLVLNVTSTAGSGTYTIWNFIAPASTTIINNVTGNLFELTESTANHIGFTGIYIEQGTGAGKAFQANPATNGKPIIWYDFRSKDSPGEFIDTTMSRGLVFRWYAHGGGPPWNGAVPGAYDIFGVRIKHFSPDANGWNQPNTMGVDDPTGTRNLYIENCYFANCTMVTDWDDNARGVLRYCVLDNSTAASHGADTSFHGMLHVEYYNNVCIYDNNGDNSMNLQSFFEWRGGTGVFANNSIDDIAGALVGSKVEIKLQVQCLDRNAGPYGLWGQGVAGVQYPAPRQVGLGNVTGTTSVTATSTNSNGTANNDSFGIYKGDFCPIYAWGNSDAGNFTTPSAESSGYNEGTPDSPSGYIQIGRDWINSVKPNYAAYAYPHPLRSGINAMFPLSVASSGRYLQDATGAAFLIHGDTPWSLAVQLTDAEVDQYIDDRAARGFTAIMFNAVEHYFSSQTPAYRNVSGVDPFSNMADFGSTMTSAYWTRVDRIVNRCKAAGMVCIINPAYIGYAGLEEGWDTELLAMSDASLQTYGANLANRYTQGNVIWCFAGDATPDATLKAKQLQILTGIRSVRTTDIVTAHCAPGIPAYPTYNGTAGFNLNTTYPGDQGEVYTYSPAEYARSPVMPFLMLEGIYEQERASPISAAGLRRQSYQALLSGACGQMFGNSPIWHFESPNRPFSYSGTWESNLSSTGSVQQQYVRQLFAAFEWWKLEPKTDTSLVTSSLGTGTSRVCPALASDGTFAMIWVPASQSVTVNLNALTGITSNVLVRRFNPTDGTYTTINTYAKSSSQSIASGAEGVLVLTQG